MCVRVRACVSILHVHVCVCVCMCMWECVSVHVCVWDLSLSMLIKLTDIAVSFLCWFRLVAKCSNILPDLLSPSIYIFPSVSPLPRYTCIWSSVCLSVSLPVCLSVSLSLCLSVSLSLCLSACLPACRGVSFYSVTTKSNLKLTREHFTEVLLRKENNTPQDYFRPPSEKQVQCLDILKNM